LFGSSDDDDRADRTHANIARPASLDAIRSGVTIEATGTDSAASSAFTSRTVLTWHPMVRSYMTLSA
jgi:hypothetical protein